MRLILNTYLGKKILKGKVKNEKGKIQLPFYV